MSAAAEISIDLPSPPGQAIGAQKVPEYHRPRNHGLTASLAPLIVALVRAYAAAFREIWPLKAWWPVPPLPATKLRLVVRYDHVVEVLSRPDIFNVPFGQEIARLNDGHAPGTPFLLGIDNPTDHTRGARCLMAHLGLDEIAAFEKMCFEAAESKLPEKGRFEAIHNLITAVPVEACREYYGLSIPDPAKFAAAAIELSGHLFGPPPIEQTKDRREDKAGDYVRYFVDQAIANAGTSASTRHPATLASKLHSAGASPHEARAVLMGMIVGFVPTNTLAGGYILDTLLNKPEAMRDAIAAADAGDDDRLSCVLFEALRFRPINLGPFRTCKKSYRLAGVDIAEGQDLWVMTGSAMWDSEKVPDANKFDPMRPASSYLHFGSGMHWCIGAMLAKAQLTQTFKALLRRGEPTRRSALRYTGGLFPDGLNIFIPGRDA